MVVYNIFNKYYSGIVTNFETRLLFGDVLDLRKGIDYDISETETIETSDDLYPRIVSWVEDRKFDKTKFWSFVVDGPLRKLGNQLKQAFNPCAIVVWCFAHRYSLLWKNALKDDLNYQIVESGCSSIKSWFGHSNIAQVQLNHCAAMLQMALLAFDNKDDKRYVWFSMFETNVS